MPTYIALVRYMQQDSRDAKETPARVGVAKQTLGTTGAELKANYLVTGQYDYVAIVEAPDDENRDEVRARYWLPR